MVTSLPDMINYQELRAHRPIPDAIVTEKTLREEIEAPAGSRVGVAIKFRSAARLGTEGARSPSAVLVVSPAMGFPFLVAYISLLSPSATCIYQP